MRRISILILFLISQITLFSQESCDVLYLTNGTKIKGTIVQENPENNVIIRTDDGFLYSFSRIEIEQILKEYIINENNYGSNFSQGFNIGGPGLIGSFFRFHPSTNFAFEIDLSYKPGLFKIKYGSSSKIFYRQSAVIAAGPNFYFGRRIKEGKPKVISDGITIKGGFGFWQFESVFITAGWIHESFKVENKNRSFNFELGPALKYYTYSINQISDEKFNVAIYLKFQWNWFKV